MAGRIMSDAKKPGLDARHRDRNGSETVQLRQVDKMLTRIEREGKALSASADRLLRRVSVTCGQGTHRRPAHQSARDH